MRFLILSDIHSNLDALEAVLAAAPAYDVVANLGDIVGYGACPNEVIDRSRELGKIFVRGNHDKTCAGIADIRGFNYIAAAAVVWTHNALTPENLQWLKDLPQGPLKMLFLGKGLSKVQLFPENWPIAKVQTHLFPNYT